jgi:hypothetical protein
MTFPRLERVFSTAEVPSDWKLVRLTLDWSGNPLLLFVEGKPPRPDFHTNMEAWSRWYQTPPKAHHLVYREADRIHLIAFDHSHGLSTFHVQPFEDGWLLGDRRGGQTTLYDANGAVHSSLDLGDASEDLQTTSDGRIWVSYFDEGVFGSGIGRQGLVCFTAAGKPMFQYADFAERNSLPMICDCYALNVDHAGVIWLNYYTDFPLIRLREFEIDQVWREFGVLGGAFAVRGEEVVYLHEKQIAARSLTSTSPREPLLGSAQDDAGSVLALDSQRYAGFAARGASFAVMSGDAVYKMRN